ncbi:MAG: four helix bundle protein [Bdellovibrionota bacterium]
MLENFRTYQLAVQLYRECKHIKLPYHLKDQLNRAASSVALNLSEGSAKPTSKDRMRFYAIAFGSLREVQTIIELEGESLEPIRGLADNLGAHLYQLCRG